MLVAVAVMLAGPSQVHAKKKSAVGPPVVRTDTLKTEFLQSAGAALVGEEAPWIAGWTLDGDVWNLRLAFSDTTTDRVAIVFFASWCAPCRHGLDVLRARSADLSANRVQVVLVNLQEDADKVRSFVGERPRFPVVLDRYGATQQTYLRTVAGSVALPQTVVVRRDGRIQAILGREGADYVDRIIAGR